MFVSGPRRYEYDSSSRSWLNTRDGTEMTERLRSEILEATGIEIYSSE
jgi:frataxin-like iron-binding protein CyaY